MDKITSNFMQQMVFAPEYTGRIGCEREFFITNDAGIIVPRAHELLTFLNRADFSYELSACQLEYKVGPIDISQLAEKIDEQEQICRDLESRFGCNIALIEAAPLTMPLDVYPDERYERFARTKTPEQLLSMLRITSCQFHVGMKDYDMALRVYNHAITYLDYLCGLCDHSGGVRLATYKTAAPKWDPKPIANIDEHIHYATEHGYINSIRDCHTLIRISRYGTIEFRMFGVAQTTEEVLFLAREVKKICDEVM